MGRRDYSLGLFGVTSKPQRKEYDELMKSFDRFSILQIVSVSSLVLVAGIAPACHAREAITFPRTKTDVRQVKAEKVWVAKTMPKFFRQGMSQRNWELAIQIADHGDRNFYKSIRYFLAKTDKSFTLNNGHSSIPCHAVEGSLSSDESGKMITVVPIYFDKPVHLAPGAYTLTTKNTNPGFRWTVDKPLKFQVR
jgi:hypothetical protein